jgi:hypothetical protein
MYEPAIPEGAQLKSIDKDMQNLAIQYNNIRLRKNKNYL